MFKKDVQPPDQEEAVVRSLLQGPINDCVVEITGVVEIKGVVVVTEVEVVDPITSYHLSIRIIGILKLL